MRILAFDIGGTAIKIGIITEDGNIIEKKEIETKVKEGGEALLLRLFNEIKCYKNNILMQKNINGKQIFKKVLLGDSAGLLGASIIHRFN